MTSNYVIAAYGGARRDKNAEYEADRSYFLREHLAALSEVENSLSLVTIVAPPPRGPDPVEYGVRYRSTNPAQREASYEEFLKNLPRRVGSAEVRFLRRSTNAGFSYGSWHDAYENYSVKRGERFDWWWFVEDDYVFVQDGFDALLAEQAKEDSTCGYLASLVQGTKDPGYHASMPHGLLRGEALRDLHGSLGELSHSDSVDDYVKVVVHGQCGFSLDMAQRTKWRLRSMTDRWTSLFRNCDEGGSVVGFSADAEPTPVIISPVQCWREVRANGWSGERKKPCME